MRLTRFFHLKCLHLGNVLTDIFGKNGRTILSGISSGKTVDQIIEAFLQMLGKKVTQIREILDREISQSAAIRLQICLNLIKHLDDEIKLLEEKFSITPIEIISEKWKF